MRAFRFPLDRVLEWYREQCTVEETRLAAAITALNAALESIARLEAERRAVDCELVTRGSIAARDLAAWGLYRLRCTQLAAQLERDRLQRKSAADDQRIKVQAARRRLRLLEKLRERRLAEHILEEDRELEQLAGESYLARWTGHEAAGA
jgi:flagellar export protein FliJ